VAIRYTVCLYDVMHSAVQM